MPEITKKTINRSTLIAVAKVLDQFRNDENDSVSMGEIRERAFAILPREDMLKIIDFAESPMDYEVEEDVTE